MLGGLLLAVGSALYLGLGFFLGFHPFGSEKTSPTYIQILLDSSSAMEDRFFGGLTRIEASVQALDNQLLSQDLGSGSRLALRQYGGSCNGANSRIAVSFAPDNQDRISAALSELDIGGDATFAQGMAEGTRDFGDAEQSEGELNTIIAIVGSGDFCAPALAVQVLNDQIHSVESRITIRVIGLDLPPDQKTSVEQAVAAMGGETFFVITTVELENTLGAIIQELQENRQRLASGDDSFLQTPIPSPEEVLAVTPPTAATPAGDASDQSNPADTGSGVGQTATPIPTADADSAAASLPTPEPTATPTAAPTPPPPPAPTSTPVPTSTPTLAAPTPTPAPTAPVVLPTSTPLPPSTMAPTPLPEPPDCYATFVPTAPTPSGQSLPHVMVGVATIDGITAPDGTALTAWVDGNLAAATSLTQGRFGFSVEPPPGGSYIGKTVLFRVGECQASPTIAWRAGAADPIELTANTQE